MKMENIPASPDGRWHAGYVGVRIVLEWLKQPRKVEP